MKQLRRDVAVDQTSTSARRAARLCVDHRAGVGELAPATVRARYAIQAWRAMVIPGPVGINPTPSFGNTTPSLRPPEAPPS
jgi:hypothetical protein